MAVELLVIVTTIRLVTSVAYIFMMIINKKTCEKCEEQDIVKTPTQHNTTVGFDEKMTVQTPPHPTPPTHHRNSMSAISQLLLTRF